MMDMNDAFERFYIAARTAYSRDRRPLFAFIWKHYSRRIAFYIGNFIPSNHPHFEDMFQDVMLKIFEHLDEYTPGRSFRAWIYAICRHRCLDFLNSKEQRIQRNSQPEYGEIPDNCDPHEHLLRRDTQRCIDDYFRSLPPSDREIAVLRFHEQMKFREIAAVTGVNVNTVKYRVTTFKKELLARLQGDA